MASIDEIIKREPNPFDPTTFRPGNFWGEKQDLALRVDSIHQDAIAQIQAFLDLVAKDHHSRTLMLIGDSGSGKSYLLGRLKRTLNPKAFFAYVGPWADSDYIWRHILRYTVDSLMHVPEGQQDSQLMLWLKSLVAFKQLSVKQLMFNEDVWNLLRSDRQKFIKKLKDTYKQASIYNPDIFFGVLHELTNPELYPLACEWLRGDDLSEESMQVLKVKRCIDSEDAAKNILANFGRICSETQPIVLCFDNLDNIPRLPDGFQDLQALFNFNTTVHNDYLKNFLVIISIITDNWRRNSDRIQQADQARIDGKVYLKNITLDQGEALWASRLQPLHRQANPQPTSLIFPLKAQKLGEKFPGGRTDPRNVLDLGRQLFQEYKEGEIISPDILTVFKLVWQNEYSQIQKQITKVTLLSAPELIQMLQETLSTLDLQEIKLKLLSGKFASYSLSYKQSEQKKPIGIVWTEDPSMSSFVYVMNACQKVIDQNLCHNLHLIRGAAVGNAKLAGYQIYKKIFTGSNHCHIKPTLSSVHYLATYHNLVNAAEANELVVAGKTITLQKLQQLIRDSGILNQCILLQNLKVVEPIEPIIDINEIKQFILNFVKTQSFLARSSLIQNTLSNLSQFSQNQIDQAIQELCQQKRIKILDDKVKPEEQLICFIPHNNLS